MATTTSGTRSTNRTTNTGGTNRKWHGGAARLTGANIDDAQAEHRRNRARAAKLGIVGIAEMADALGVDPGRLTRLKQQGNWPLKPVAMVSGREGYELDAAKAWWRELNASAKTTQGEERRSRTRAKQTR